MSKGFVRLGTLVLLALLFGSSASYGQTLYAYHVGIGSGAGAYGHWTSFEAAAQVGAKALQEQYNTTVTVGDCPPGINGVPGIGEGCLAFQNGQIYGGFFTTAIASPVSPKDVGNCPTCVGDPVALPIGNKFVAEQDYRAPGSGGLRFVRIYNSAPVSAAVPGFAEAWVHNYGMVVTALTSTSTTVTRPDGKTYSFTWNSGTSTWVSDADVTDQLVQVTGGWQYTNASDDSIESYDISGNLLSIAHRDGTTVSMTYATSGGVLVFPAQLLTVTDSFGKSLTFSYPSGTRTMTDPAGNLYTYALGPSDEITSVTYPSTTGTTVKGYLYNETAYNGGTSQPYALTGIMDETPSRYDTTWYDSNGFATQTALAGAQNQYSMNNSLNGSGGIQNTVVTSPLGGSSMSTFSTVVGRNLIVSANQTAASGQPAGSRTWSYDASGNVSSSTDLNGNLTCSVFDARNLESGRVEGMAPGSTCPSNISTYVPASGTVERKTLTVWHGIWHLPLMRAEPRKITTWTYNGDGGVYCAPSTAMVGSNPIGVLCSRSEKGTTDATGGAGFGATPQGSARVWKYTYNAFGQVLTANGPRTDVIDTTTYMYYSCATGTQCGQVHTISNALSQVTTFLTYDGNGNPLTISDPNGVVTTLVYDPRQRLKSKKVGTETTSYTYYPTGLLNIVTRPDGSTIQNFYDSAHRLTRMTDGLGNSLKYTLDAMGNRKFESALDSASTVHRKHSRAFNALNSLYQDINSANSAAVTTTLGYDANGNVLTSNAPLSRNTVNTYDALNRLSQITDPLTGITKFGYDLRDNLTSVIDPNTHTTTYTVNGFGEVTKIVSPDSGTTVKTYDNADNLSTTTDARSALATYTYDVLNRESQVAYSDQTITYTYDSGTNGIGRLTGASDTNHSMTWGYDTLGRVNAKGQTIGTSATQSVGYSYTNGDLITLTTPSGQVVTYTYTNHRVTSIVINSTTLLSGVTYDPFGPATGWTWGNGPPAVTRSFDFDGLPQSLTSAGVTYGYTPDNATRIQSISDSGLTSDSFTFGYDLLDHVTSAAITGGGSGISRGYTYDAAGNRKTTTGTTPSTENIIATNNHLNTTTGSIARTYSYDAAGNGSYTGEAFTFNQRGRMSSATSSSGTTNYIYNALNQLIQKSGVGGTVSLVYDEAGHLLGEYSSTGNYQETIWMEDLPVATIQHVSSTTTTYYIHSDHLGTPRKITRPSDNALMWRWDPDTFGSVAPTATGVTYNLRFAGQYFLSESGLFYNYFRTYDPEMGRYVEADPIGLKGGINTYGYVGGNPISRIDPKGLQTPALCLNPANVEACAEAGEISAAQADALRRAAKAAAAAAAAANCKSDEPNCVRASAFHLAGAGILDAEEFKRDYVGSAGGRFDICACKDGSILIAAVGQCGQSGPKISTGLTWKK